MSNDFVRQLSGKARRRAVASIMEYSERRFAHLMGEEEWQGYRDKVLNALSVYHDSMMDIMLTLGEGPGVVNEVALRLLEQVQTDQARIARAVEARTDRRVP